VPYREPTLRPPTVPSWTPARVALVLEAALDRVALVTTRVASHVERSSLRVQLLLGLVVGVTLGVLAGVVIVMLRPSG
jgi:ABC-type nitrate/sulfonate/bicarbonate transport system permease component